MMGVREQPKGKNMEPTTSVYDLAQTLKKSEANHSSLERSLLFHREVAGDLIAEGYRKPRVLGYVPVNREGAIRSRPFHTREEVQVLVDAWNSADGAINYSVAEIAEPSA